MEQVGASDGGEGGDADDCQRMRRADHGERVADVFVQGCGGFRAEDDLVDGLGIASAHDRRPHLGSDLHAE
jgi:hypothetical protein